MPGLQTVNTPGLADRRAPTFCVLDFGLVQLFVHYSAPDLAQGPDQPR